MSESSDGDMLLGSGRHSRAEILSEPACWGTCLQQLATNSEIAKICDLARGVDEWIFVGCGSSYYIGLAAAASWSKLTGIRARAIPASEILLFPELAFAGTKNVAAVALSRSGRTSETVRAAEFLEREKNVRTVALTCSQGQALEKVASLTLVLPAANEESMVMTRSFTSMVLALQFIAATLGKNSEFLAALRDLPTAAEKAMALFHPQIRELVSSHEFNDYVYLGQGPFYGLACEAALKVTEMSVSYGQCFHTLEFRHGPKSIVSPETMIGILLSESNFEIELEVLQEVKSLGGTTLVFTPRRDPRVKQAADLMIELDFEMPEFARMISYLLPAQLLGLYTGLKKGLDPDSPRNLSRAVILQESNSSRKK